MHKEKRLVTQRTIEQLADNIIAYAEKNGMTIKNIRNSVALVGKYMKNNAILEKRDPNQTESAEERKTDKHRKNYWNRKEVYYDRKTGKVNCEVMTREEKPKVSRKVPVVIEVKINKDNIDQMLEISKKVDELRNEHPFADTHFIIEY